MLKIAIVGRRADTVNYVRYVKSWGGIPYVTLNPGEVTLCNALLLPGGGDITPAFFGEQNHGSRNIDTELDIIQLQALDVSVRSKIPVLGICKGMQIINVGFGGTITQDLPTNAHHKYIGRDQYHTSIIKKGSWLHLLYGEQATVNSAHHQAIHHLGKNLTAVQHCPFDHCIEAISHSTLPIFGVQWHPERINSQFSDINGAKILAYLFSKSQSLR